MTSLLKLKAFYLFSILIIKKSFSIDKSEKFESNSNSNSESEKNTKRYEKKIQIAEIEKNLKEKNDEISSYRRRIEYRELELKENKEAIEAREKYLNSLGLHLLEESGLEREKRIVRKWIAELEEERKSMTEKLS